MIKVNNTKFSSIHDAADYIVGSSNNTVTDTAVRKQLKRMLNGAREYGVLYNKFVVTAGD